MRLVCQGGVSSMRLRIKKGELLFTSLIAAYVLMLSVLCFGYSAESRLFPLLVIVPTILFLVLRFISIGNPELSKILEPETGLLDIEKVQRFAKAEAKEEKKQNGFRELVVVIWVIGLLLLTFLVGIMPAIALFVFLFVKFYGQRKMATAVAYTAATWIFVYLLFIVVLQARLYGGVLGISIFE